ncbi:MAG: hypothetical protein HQK65_09030 [Desulfamplus sp.]|nr:hypothetical protein [Desulfamplus sp.]
MKVKIPKQYKGAKFNKLFSIECNDFSIEMLLPAFFFLLESKGKQRLKSPESEKFDEYILKLKKHPNLEGFTDIDGQRLLDKWAKTSLMVIGKKGRAGNKNQILYLQPLTYLTFKGGFPSESSRLRNVNYFLYKLMISALEKNDEHHGYKIIRDTLRKAFAEGISGLPEKDAGTAISGQYDGHTTLDTETLLSLFFMDSFEPIKISSKKKISADPPICEGQAERLMKGFIKFITIFKKRMPSRELIYNLQTLLNFELFIYTLKLIYGTNQLIITHELPLQFSTEMTKTAPLLYVDVGSDTKGFSREIACQCVSRDLQELSLYHHSLIKLKILDTIVGEIPVLKKELNNIAPQELLLKLIKLSDHSDIQAQGRIILSNIRNDNNFTEENSELKEYMNRLELLHPEDSIERLVTLLEEIQRNKMGQNMIGWFKNVSGVNKPYGFIQGSLRHRYTWAYSLSNDLLWTLVHLASIHPDKPTGNNPDWRPKRTRLVDFLNFLEERYGIVIHKVPKGMGSIEANRAARENLAALQKRLRQMGLFENLSDDFEAQYITPQYTQEIN